MKLVENLQMIPPFGDVLWISGKPLESDTLTEASKAAVFGALGGASSAALFGWWVSSPSGIVASKAWSSSLLYCAFACCSLSI